jgi:cytosine/adenosine deaminase-related metal-dependent hydrolase
MDSDHKNFICHFRAGLWHDDGAMCPKLVRVLLRAIVVVSLWSIAPIDAAGASPNVFLIRGNIVTPSGVIANGWLEIRSGRILLIQRERPDVTGAPTLETTDLVVPGFIDLHNHPSYNVFPRWTPPHKYADRYEWRDSEEYRTRLEFPAVTLSDDPGNFCDIDEYVEVKALIGGTTSMIGMSAPYSPKGLPDCVKGLVRNLGLYTGFYSAAGSERIVNSIGITARDMDANAAARDAQSLADGSIDLLAIHIAEGLPTDAESAQELDMLDAHGLLTAHTALIHALGLSPSQVARVHRAGASIVWSPRSNFELYGATADVGAWFREGVTISIAPDWAPTGSDNMFDEVKYAAGVSREKLGGLFSSRQLVEMASSIPARVAHIDDKVGTLAPGMLADFFLIHPGQASTGDNPYEAMIAGQITDIDLVVIGGIPVYGKAELLEKLGVKTETLSICGAPRALNSDALRSGTFAAVTARLDQKIKALGSELAPLAECIR